MSNSSVILRLENKLEDFISRKISQDDFAQYVNDSIEALEGINYQTIKKARDFQYRFETAAFNIADWIEEDPDIESVDAVVDDFKLWLNSLR